MDTRTLYEQSKDWDFPISINRGVDSKTIFHRGREWAWPPNDDKMMICFKHVHLLPKYLRYVGKFDVCVQAGGAGGVFADYLADYFADVYTFEPAKHYEYLVKNTTKQNVHCEHVALSDKAGHVDIRQPDIDNFGSIYTVPGSTVPSVRLDDVVDRVDFMLLDIEGNEAPALKGAEKLINKCKPVIAVENKPLPQGRAGDPKQWLIKNHGYRFVERIGRDDILIC